MDNRVEIDALVGIFGRGEKKLQCVKINGIEVHPAAAGHRIAKFIFNPLGLEFGGCELLSAA